MVDPTGTPLLFALAVDPDAPGACLHQGLGIAEFIEYAPCLLAVREGTFDRLAELGALEDSALFVLTDKHHESLLEHWRRFLTVERPGLPPSPFRFYDPEIAQLYIEHSTDEEVRAFLGPCSALGGMREDILTFSS